MKAAVNCYMLHRSNLPAFLWNTSLITQSGRQLSFQPFSLLCWGSCSPWVSLLFFFSVLLQVLWSLSQLSVACHKVFVAHLAVAVVKHLIFSLSFTKRRAGTLHTGHNPDSSLQVAVNPISICLSSYTEKPAHLALLRTFRKGMPWVAAWGGWEAEGTGELVIWTRFCDFLWCTFCKTDLQNSICRVNSKCVDVQEGDQQARCSCIFSLWYITGTMSPVTLKAPLQL